jgi:hypothetical protein
MPEATQSGINIGGKWYDAAPPSSGKRDAKRRLAEVSVEFTEPGNLGIGWEVLGRNEILAVFTTEKLGIDWVSWGSSTGHHVHDHSHVVVERLKPEAAEARDQRIKPGCYLVRIGEEFSKDFTFNEVLEIVKKAPRPLRLVLGHPSAPSATRSSPDCVVWSIDKSAAAASGGRVRPGMALAKVNGVSIRGKLVEQLEAEIAEAERPVRLTFRERRIVRSRSDRARTPSSAASASASAAKSPPATDRKTPPRTPRSPPARGTDRSSNGKSRGRGNSETAARSPAEGLPPTRLDGQHQPTGGGGVDSSVGSQQLPEAHRVLWEGWLYRLLPDHPRRRYWFLAYQSEGENCCRLAYREDSPGQRELSDEGAAAAAATTAVKPAVMQWNDGSPCVQVRAPTSDAPGHFVLRTRDGGEYQLSAGDAADQVLVAQAVVRALQGHELKSDQLDKDGRALLPQAPISQAPPIIPVAAAASATAAATAAPVPAGAAAGAGGAPLAWIVVGLMVLFCSTQLEMLSALAASYSGSDGSGGYMSLLLGNGSSIIFGGGSIAGWVAEPFDEPVEPEPPSCASTMDCGPHGSLRVFSSLSERASATERAGANAASGSGGGGGGECACVCEDGWGGEDCSIAILDIFEISLGMAGQLADSLSSMHRNLHEGLARLANDADSSGSSEEGD